MAGETAAGSNSGPANKRIVLDSSDSFQVESFRLPGFPNWDDDADSVPEGKEQAVQGDVLPGNDLSGYQLNGEWDAKVRYQLDEVVNGQENGKAASLMVLSFIIDCTDKHPATDATITVTFGHSSTTPLLATDRFWPLQVLGPVSDVTVTRNTTLSLKVTAGGVAVETPSIGHTITSKPTDRCWSIAGDLHSVKDAQNGYQWQVSGNDVDVFPVPHKFSVGMIVQHNGADYWANVQIAAKVRGLLPGTELRAHLEPGSKGYLGFKPVASKTVLDGALLQAKMVAKYEEIFAGSRYGGAAAGTKSTADGKDV